jgi:hypothetical protein
VKASLGVYEPFLHIAPNAITVSKEAKRQAMPRLFLLIILPYAIFQETISLTTASNLQRVPVPARSESQSSIRLTWTLALSLYLKCWFAIIKQNNE